MERVTAQCHLRAVSLFIPATSENFSASATTAWITLITISWSSMATLPQGNQELLVVRDKVGRPSGELEVSTSVECDIFPFSALTLLVG